MEYNDLQLRAFSKIAYFDLEDRLNERAAKRGYPIPLKDLLNTNEIEQLAVLGISKDDFKEWSIAAVHDGSNNKNPNGFFACVIQTSPGNAAVAFRGSENMMEFEHAVRDWKKGDFALMNSIMTEQHAETERFLKDNADLLSKYDNITMTGHSLGGNLADYATIISARKYPWLAKRIKQCVSLDGPGFSDEFLKEYSSEIAQMSGKMKHYQWSFVGSLLNYLPGVDLKTIDVKAYVSMNEDGVNQINKYGCFTRHSLEYTSVGSDGMFCEGKQDLLSLIMHKASLGVDHMPAIVGNAFIEIVGGLFIAGVWAKDQIITKDKFGSLSLTGTGYFVVIGLAAVFITLIAAGLLTIPLVIKALLVVALIVVAAVVYELFYEYILVPLADFICDAVAKICEWTKEFAQNVKNAVIDSINKLAKWWKSLFNDDRKAVRAYTQIVVDTRLLRSYAERLNVVNARINTLDQRLNSLYSKVGVRGILKLINADVMMESGKRLRKCSTCLIDTAADFEQIEQELINSFQ